MRRKKRMQEMSIDELMELAKHAEEVRQRRQWLKTAPREETVLRYRAPEKPCPVPLYLQAEHHVLRWFDEFPGLKGDAIAILLTLAHKILHLLYPEKGCGPRTEIRKF